MWYPATITVAASSEPVSLAQARTQCRIDSSQTEFDDDLNRFIASARAHVEKRLNSRLATQTVTLLCDGFEDFARLPEGPVQSITSIAYVDTAGDSQTLATSVYEARIEGIEAAIVLKYGQTWPSIRLGSRITVTAVVGYASLPADIQHALLLFISRSFQSREPIPDDDWSTLDSLLCNHIRGI